MSGINDIGLFGESAVVKYLENKGFLILEKNFNVDKIGEIDIIAAKNGILHFVEVKTSLSTPVFHEKHSLSHFDQNKKDRIARVMDIYAVYNNATNMTRCVDIAAVSISTVTKEVRIVYEANVYMSTI